MASAWLVVAILAWVGDDPNPIRLDFEDAAVGKLPAGWSAAKTGEGPGSVWTIIDDATAPRGAKVLAQTSSEGPSPLFNLCVNDAASFRDVDLAVAFKPVSGKLDQGGGLVWRYRDANNYYVARMNPLENNFRVYKVVGGKRTQLGTANVEASAGQWHTLRVIHEGDHIRCLLNGKPHLEVRDQTFSDAGKVGLWTKADAVTSFDDFKAATPGGPGR